MQQLTFVAPGQVEWTDLPPPTLREPGDALVRPVAVTTCDLDHIIIAGGVPLPGPFPLGHEFVADVVSVGDACTDVRVAQRVVVPFQISCGRCARCRRGHTGCCEAVPRRASYGLGPIGGLEWGGAFTDLVRVPFADAMLVGLPAGVRPDAVAGASDNLSDAWRTVAPSLLGDAPGAEVLIVGGGARSIGLYAVAVARALGASRVDYLDADPGRLAVAERMGGHGIEGPPPTRAGNYPVTVDASGDPAGLTCALRSTTSWGRCTSVGVYWTDVALPLLDMYGRGVVFVTGRANARADLPAVLAKVADGTLDPTPVHTGIYRWEDAPRVMTSGEMKPVFVRDA